MQSGKGVCEIIRALGLAGANVTTPFKEDVIEYLDKLSPEAERIAAVNTIINRNGELTGYNTDPAGITGSLFEAGIDPGQRKCLVIGAGGAGKAAALGLVNAGADVLIANRSALKAKDYAKNIGCSSTSLEDAITKLKSFDILVLTIPPGIYPFNKDQIHPGHIIVDANYRSPSSTSLIDWFSCKIVKGDRWLLHQAVEAYRLFTGKAADATIMEKGLGEELDNQGLVIKIIKDDTINQLSFDNADMMIDGRGLDDEQINRIIDEEKDKAFTDKG